MRYDLEDDPRADVWAVFGVAGPTAVAVREERAVRGVGALINDFLGVSFSCLLRLPLKLEDGVLFITDVDAFCRRPTATKGWRMAACGFILLSGSQMRHFETKSTKSSSLHRRTCTSDFVPGLRRRPLELMTARGAPFGSREKHK